MHLRTLVPLVLLLSACAEVPISEDGPLSTSTPPLQQESTPAAVATTPRASPPALPPLAPAPQLAVAREPSAPVVRMPEPETPKDLWHRINKGYALRPMDNDAVRDWENWYSSRPDYVARMIERSSRYLYHIVEQVEKRGMPMEVALLPMIESAYNPVAYSRSHASGIWQFIPSTGKHYGLRQNWWYDGRRDILAATGAALDYLEKLYRQFNDWPLALAAYNWGEGAVGRAIERNRAKGLPTDYESLTVPAETRGYVPKLMAVKNIISNPARYGLVIASIPNEPYFETLIVAKHIDVKVAAKMAEMPIEEFKFLNPGHNKLVIKAGEAERIVLPKNKVATFLANYNGHDKRLVSWQAVTLQRGQKAESVAAQHGMTLAELKEVNGLAHQTRFAVGQPLLVPLKSGVDEPTLIDLPATRVTLPKALQAAKAAAQAKKVAVRGGKAGTQKVASSARKPVGKAGTQHVASNGRKPAVGTVRAQAGKQAKTVASRAKGKPVTSSAQREKERVASR